MIINCGFKAENVRQSIISSLLSKVIMIAHAEEVPADGAEGEHTQAQTQVNFEQMLAQVRKEEKDKLYPRIKKLEDDLKLMTSSNNTNLLESARLKQEIETLKAQGDDNAVIKEKDKKIAELEETVKQLKESTPDEKALREQIKAEYKAEYEVKNYLNQQLADNKDKILPRFAKDIKGATKEEIDASIQSAITDTLETKKELGLVDEEGNPIDTTKKTAKKEKPPVANPSGAKDEEYDLEYVKNLDPRSKDYAEWRRKQGLK